MRKRGTELPGRRIRCKIDVNERVERAFETGTPIDEAFDEACLDAIRLHKQAGQPMVVWRDGKTVLIPAEEIEAELNAGKTARTKPAAPRKRRTRKEGQDHLSVPALLRVGADEFDQAVQKRRLVGMDAAFCLIKGKKGRLIDFPRGAAGRRRAVLRRRSSGPACGSFDT